MTPKEKAKELISKFNFIHDSEKKEYIIYQTVDESKRCTLIAIDEILRLIPTNNTLKLSDYSYINFKYWQEVKEEINKF